MSGPGAHQTAAFVVYRAFDIGSPRLEAGNLLHFGENKAPSHSTSLSLHSCNVAGEARGFPCILDDADGSVVVGHATNDLVSST